MTKHTKQLEQFDLSDVQTLDVSDGVPLQVTPELAGATSTEITAPWARVGATVPDLPVVALPDPRLELARALSVPADLLFDTGPRGLGR